jgi:hypothetical protein
MLGLISTNSYNNPTMEDSEYAPIDMMMGYIQLCMQAEVKWFAIKPMHSPNAVAKKARFLTAWDKVRAVAILRRAVAAAAQTMAHQETLQSLCESYNEQGQDSRIPRETTLNASEWALSTATSQATETGNPNVPKAENTEEKATEAGTSPSLPMLMCKWVTYSAYYHAHTTLRARMVNAVHL